MEITNPHPEHFTFFIGTYGFGATRDFIAQRAERKNSFSGWCIDNPFIQLSGIADGFVVGYEDWTHARHVTHLNGCQKHRIALLKVEMHVDSFSRLLVRGDIARIAEFPKKQIVKIRLAELLELPDTEVTFTVLAPTGFPAIPLDEFDIPELLADLKSMRCDCLQSLMVEMPRKEELLKNLFGTLSIDYDELLDRLVERSRSSLSPEEVEALIALH